MQLSIIIPCKNEERRIGATLERVAEFIAERQIHSARPDLVDVEVIVVDNGSTDRTRHVAESCRPMFQAFRVLEESRYGKGWAVRRGMLSAAGRYRLFMDADNSTDVFQVGLLMGMLEDGYDVAVSSRRLPGAKLEPPQPVWRRRLGDAFALIVAALVPTDVRDTQNGFKLFTAEATYRLFAPLRSFYWAFDVELLARARRDGLSVAEVPVRWVNDDRSQMNFKGMVRMLFEVVAIRFRLWGESLRAHRLPAGERARHEPQS
jgi:glycosyltransferase involved in cell wall biosynthesis